MRRKRVLALMMAAMLAAGGIGETAMAAALDFSDGAGAVSEEAVVISEEDNSADEFVFDDGYVASTPELSDGEEDPEAILLTDGEQSEEEAVQQEGAETGENQAAVFFYELPNEDVSQLVGWDMGINKETYCYVEETPDTDGYMANAVISSVRTENVQEEGEEQPEGEIVEVSPYDDGNGWNLHMNQFGHARVYIDYVYTASKGEEKSGTHTFDIFVGGTVYYLDISSETETNRVLPGASLDLRADVHMYCYDEEQGHYDGNTDNIKVEWSLENAEDAMISIEEDIDDNRVLHVNAKETTEKATEKAEERIFANAVVMREDGSQETVASTEFWVVVQQGYYQIRVENKEELKNLEPGDTASVKPVLYSYSIGSQPTEVTKEIRYRVEGWDRNAVAITDAKGLEPDENGVCGSFPITVKKLQNWDTGFELVAEIVDGETGNTEELDRYYIPFHGRDYGTWFEDCRGGDHTWVFSDEDLRLCLNTENIPGFSENEKYSIEWIVGTRDENGEYEEVFGEDTYQSAGSEIVLHGAVLKNKMDNLGTGTWFDISAVVKVNGVEVSETGMGVEVRDPVYDYRYPCSGPGENQMLPGEGIFISNRMNVYVENSDYPHGRDMEIQITSLEKIRYGEWNEAGEEITSDQEKISITGNEDGWDLHGEDFGFVELKATYISLPAGEEEEYIFSVYAIGDIYELGWEYMNGTDCMLPNEEMEIYLNVSYRYNWDGENHYEEAEDYRLEFGTDDDGNPFYDTNLIQAELDKDENGRYVLRVASGQEYGSTDICVRVLIPNDDGEYEERCDNWIHINVNDAFDNFEPIVLEDEEGNAVNPGVGETVDLSTFEYKLVRHAEGREPEILNGIRFRFRDYDSNVWEIQEGSDELLPVLKRISPNGTDMVIVAEEYNAEQESWQDINERRYWFDGIDYSTDFTELRNWNDHNTWIFTDEAMTLSLNKERLPEEFEAEWVIGICDEESDTVIPFENPEGLYSVSSNGDSVTLYGEALRAREELNPEYSNRWFNVDVRIRIDGVEVSGCGTGVELREPFYSLRYDDYGSILVGDVYEFYNNSIDCYVESGMYPYGESISLTLADIICENTQEGANPVFEVEKSEDGRWSVKALRQGEATITFKTTSETLGEMEFVRTRYVEVEMYLLNVETDTGIDMMLPDSSLKLLTKVMEGVHDEENGENTWDTTPVSAYRLIFSDYDTNLIRVNRNGLVTSKSDTGSTSIKVTAAITMMNGMNEYICERWIDIHVENGYLKVEAEPVYAEPGESISIADIGAVLKEYSVDKRDGVSINDAEFTFESEDNGLYQLSEDGKSFTVNDGILTEEEVPVTVGITVRAVVDGMTDDEGNLIPIYGQEKIILCIHCWDEGTVTRKATCTVKGEKKFTCDRCGLIRMEEIPLAAHKPVKDPAVAATCTKDGKTEGSHCSECSAVITAQKIIPALGHDFRYTSNGDATVFADGTKTGKCSRCTATSTVRDTGSRLTPVITVNASSFPMKVGQKVTALKVTMANGDYVKSWKSSNTKIVKVSGKKTGTCTLAAQKKTGTAYITITLASGKSKKVKITVQKTDVRTTKISGLSSRVSVKKGKTLTLNPVITPISSSQKVTYASSNKSIATVTSKVVIKGIKAGTATITVKSGSKSYKVKVTVTK